jgi:hypothetical protein
MNPECTVAYSLLLAAALGLAVGSLMDNDQQVVCSVVRATLTPFLPDLVKFTRAALVPGRAVPSLAIDHEDLSVGGHARTAASPHFPPNIARMREAQCSPRC